MKPITDGILMVAANETYALEEMGVLDCEDRWDNPIESYLPDDVEFFSGASRMCFKIPSLEGWVLKVDFKGQNGYCAREVKFYKEAVKLGFGDYFASTYKVTELDDGRVVILQEEVEVDEDLVTSEWYDYVSNEYEFDDVDKTWDYVYDMEDVDRLCAVFGDDKRFNELDNFFRDRQINDLHEGNWGVTKDEGKIVLMDFAGYGVI